MSGAVAMSRRRLSRTQILGIVAASLAAVALLHWQVLFLGLQPDSLLMTQPWTPAQLRIALTGNWLSPTVDLYHRPLTTLLFAADFEIFGLNSRALHLESLLFLTVVASLLGCWLWREGNGRVAAAAMALYLTHPVLLDSTIAGEQYHFHLVPAMIVAATLWIWIGRRATPTLTRWWPILALAAVGFYFKEDTIMVVPAILVLQVLRARIFNDVPWPSRAVIGAVAVMAIVLAAIRWSVFPHFETATDSWAASAWRPW